MSLLGPRISTKELLHLCRRLATSIEAGIDMRAIWRREASGAGRASTLRRYAMVRDAVASGEGLGPAVARCGEFFPPLFRELAEVGDATGRQGDVFAQLAEYYQGRLTQWRIFLVAITWPAIELFMAVAIIGFVIWIMGVIAGPGKAIDVLGLGLVGTSGLAVYLSIVSGVGIAVVFLIQAVRRGLIRSRMIERLLFKTPVLGQTLNTLALARLAWSLHLTLNTGMDVRRAIALSVRSTNRVRYVEKLPLLDAAIESGETIHEAFVAAGGFPGDFLDAVRVGEETGNLVESMGGLAGQYQDRAKMALAALMTLAGVAVWLLIAAVIIFFIFRLAFFYIGILTRAGQGVF